MARIVMGNRDNAEALRQARSVLTELNAEWPDIQITQRTLRGDATTHLADALLKGDIGIAVQAVDDLPLDLPEGIVLAAVARRLEARSALVTRSGASLLDLPEGVVVAVQTGRDHDLLAALRPDLTLSERSTLLDDDLTRLARDEIQALLVPSANLQVLDHRNRTHVLLDPETFPPAPGQGALGVLVREEDDAAFELAYTLQHRPSLDRVLAERAFARALPGHLIGALATVSSEGDLSLFGSVMVNGTTLQVTTSGDAGDAESVGQELANDVREQVGSLS